MSRYTALLDANVLYPAPMRDLFLQLAVGEYLAILTRQGLVATAAELEAFAEFI